MCGICGIHRFGETPISRDAVDLLILNNQNRGLEAAGVALQQADGEVFVHKSDLLPYQFIASADYNKFMNTYLNDGTVTALGHTRKATKGNPKINGNNHPMYSGLTAVVHNGVIHNDDTMFKEWNLERKAETDSDIFRAVLDKEGFTKKGLNSLSQLSGSAAFAAISPKHPGKLLLGRSGNPIELAATRDFLMFSSERGPLYKALRPLRYVYGILMREMSPLDYYMIGMTDNSAWLIGEKPHEGEETWAGNWLEWHQELRIAQNFQPVNYTCHAQYHGSRVKFYDDRPVDVIECPNKQCGIFLSVPPSVLKDLKKYTCATCGSALG